ncbi:Tkl protein kinase, partial [Globisporangium splendens]
MPSDLQGINDAHGDSVLSLNRAFLRAATEKPNENEPDENEVASSASTAFSSSSSSSTASTGGAGSSLGDAAASKSDSQPGDSYKYIEVEGTSMTVEMVAGMTLAGTAVIVLIVFLLYRFCCRRKKNANANTAAKGEKDFGVATNTPDLTNGLSSGHFTSVSAGSGDPGIRSNENGLWTDDAITALRIPLEKVVVSSLLSRGGYGEVHVGTYKDQCVAIKTLLPAMRKDLRQINAFLAETKLMAALEHPRIVAFIGVAWDSLADLCVVSEFMDGGDLRALLTRFETKEHRPHGFDHDKVQIAFHVAHALTYLHSLDPIVLHRDLKSKNILLDRNFNAKITDFGVSRESSDRTMTAGVGTSLWMAPEVMMGERYDEKADIFSFGVVLSELDSHMLPYAEAKETNSGRVLPDTALLQMVSLGRLKVQLSAEAPQAMVDLADACTALEPKDRPTASDLLYRLQVMLKSHEFVF